MSCMSSQDQTNEMGFSSTAGEFLRKNPEVQGRQVREVETSMEMTMLPKLKEEWFPGAYAVRSKGAETKKSSLA